MYSAILWDYVVYTGLWKLYECWHNTLKWHCYLGSKVYGSFITGNLNKQKKKKMKNCTQCLLVHVNFLHMSLFLNRLHTVDKVCIRAQDILRGPLKHMQILRSSSPEPSQVNQVLNWEHNCDRDQVKTKAGWCRVQTRTGPLHLHENVEHGNDTQSLNWYVSSKSLSNTHRNQMNLTFSGVLVHH